MSSGEWFVYLLLSRYILSGYIHAAILYWWSFFWVCVTSCLPQLFLFCSVWLSAPVFSYFSLLSGLRISRSDIHHLTISCPHTFHLSPVTWLLQPPSHIPKSSAPAYMPASIPSVPSVYNQFTKSCRFASSSTVLCAFESHSTRTSPWLCFYTLSLSLLSVLYLSIPAALTCKLEYHHHLH